MAQQTESIQKMTRNSNIEILRFLLMTFICFLHVIVHGYNFKVIGTPEFSEELNMGLVTFFCTLFSPAVYCFMFISGWFGINFSIKKYINLAFLGICCFIISIFIKYISGLPIEITKVATHLFPISCNNWWFLTNYVFVYLMAPFIESGLKTMNKKTVKQIFFIMTFIEIAGFTRLSPNSGSSFFGLLYIYFLARYLKKYEYNFSFKSIIPLYFISFLLLWGACYWTSFLGDKYAKLAFILLGYNNPLIIIMAISIFYCFLNIKPFYSNLINRLFANVLSIYLLTEAIGEPLYNYMGETIRKSPLLGILLVISCMMLCLLLGKIINKLFDRLSKCGVKHFMI